MTLYLGSLKVSRGYIRRAGEQVILHLTGQLLIVFLNRALDVKYLNDGWWDVIELCGPVGEVFEDKATSNADIRTSIVRVIRESVPVAERQNLRRDASVAPNSSARPQDRRLGNASNIISSDINWRALQATEDAERTVKRQRLNTITSGDFQDRDKPLTSRETIISAKIIGLSADLSSLKG